MSITRHIKIGRWLAWLSPRQRWHLYFLRPQWHKRVYDVQIAIGPFRIARIARP